MAISTRIIKRRIKSVSNTRKITKAMELVAAAKMRKCVGMLDASRVYDADLQKLLREVSLYANAKDQAFLKPNLNGKQLLVICASDRGLCGGFNAQLLRKAVEEARRMGTVEIIAVGRRAEIAIRRAGFTIAASFAAISNAPSYALASPLATYLRMRTVSGELARITVAYTQFKNAVTQIPLTRELFPLPGVALRDTDEEKGNESDGAARTIEPNPNEVVAALLPRIFDTMMYTSLLESSASEHAARMMAMRSATDNAKSMQQDLTFTFNQARQASITREISEISAGKAAIE